MDGLIERYTRHSVDDKTGLQTPNPGLLEDGHRDDVLAKPLWKRRVMFVADGHSCLDRRYYNPRNAVGSYDENYRVKNKGPKAVIIPC